MRLYVLPNSYVRLYVYSYVLQNLYERWYVRLYVLPNSHVCSSVLPNLYVRSYVLPNSYGHLYVLEICLFKKEEKEIKDLLYPTPRTPSSLTWVPQRVGWPLAITAE